MKIAILLLFVLISSAFGSTQAKFSPDKPTRLFVKSYTYSENAEVHPSGNGNAPYSFQIDTKCTWSTDWTDGSGGSGRYDMASGYVTSGTLGDYFTTSTQGQGSQWPSSDWPQLVDGTITVDESTRNDNGIITTWPGWSGGCNPVEIGLEHCKVKESGSGAGTDSAGNMSQDHMTYSREAETVMNLIPGGKALSKRKSLFMLSSSARRSLGIVLKPNLLNDLNFFEARLPQEWKGMTDVEPTQIAIDGMRLGSDGKLWRLYPDGDTPIDVTPRVKNADYYTFSFSQQKHKLKILANGYPLAEDRVRPLAEYCVGQKLNFEIIFTPSNVSGLVSANPRWNFTGSYINDHYANDADCEIYQIAPYWVTQNPTRAWYYDKGKELNAYAGLYCTFENGQTAFVTTKGKFNMYRPKIEFIPVTGAFVSVRHHIAAVVFGIGDDSGAGRVNFVANILTIPKFPGEGIVTQLVNRDSSFDGIASGTDGYELDNTEVYTQTSVTNDPANPHSNLSGSLQFEDAPAVPITGASWASGNDHFKAYLRFKPHGDSDNIYITLGRADWDWHGNVLYTGGTPYDAWTLSNWTISGASVNEPTTFQDLNEFPVWTEVYNNFGF